MLRQVAEGVLIHESEFCQSNAVVVHGRAGVLLIDPGVLGHEMACLANDLSDAGLPARVRQQNPDNVRAARRAVTGRRAEPGVPEQVIPMRMRREACHNGLAQLAKVVREACHFGAVHPGVDEQHADPAVHDNGVALAELALVEQHTLRDLPQHECKATVPAPRLTDQVITLGDVRGPEPARAMQEQPSH